MVSKVKTNTLHVGFVLLDLIGVSDLKLFCYSMVDIKNRDRIHKTHLHLSAKSHLSLSVTLN